MPVKYIILAAVLGIDVQFCYREIWIHLLCYENEKHTNTQSFSLYESYFQPPLRKRKKKKDSYMVHEYMVNICSTEIRMR